MKKAPVFSWGFSETFYMKKFHLFVWIFFWGGKGFFHEADDPLNCQSLETK